MLTTIRRRIQLTCPSRRAGMSMAPMGNQSPSLLTAGFACAVFALAGCANPSGLARALADDSQQPDAKTEAAEETDQSEIREVFKQLQEAMQAWEDGKAVDVQPLADRVSKRLESKLDGTSLQIGQIVPRMLEMLGANDAAKQVYQAIERSAAKSDDQQLAGAAKEIAASGLARLNLLGTTPKIQGTLFSGDKLDWSSYKEKVVLIDFWATWCGPCLQELPNVKKAYEQYHDKGFEVVGISLDEDKEALSAFLDKEKLPWATLYNGPTAEGGFGGELVKQFGVDGIPATYLLDRQGKIVSISARGPSLEKQLEKLLGGKP